MWTHFLHLLWRIVHGMPVLVSSNWAAWIVGIVAFLLTELLLYVSTPKEERRKRLLSNLLIGFAVTVFVYGTLFVWSTIQTIYDDHHDSGGRWRTVVKEKDRLKEQLEERDKYIKELEGRKCPTCSSKVSSHSAPPSANLGPPPLTVEDLKLFYEAENSIHADAPYALNVTIQTSVPIDPLRFAIHCTTTVKYVETNHPADMGMWYGSVEPYRNDPTTVIANMAGQGKAPVRPDLPLVLHIYSSAPIGIKSFERGPR